MHTCTLALQIREGTCGYVTVQTESLCDMYLIELRLESDQQSTLMVELWSSYSYPISLRLGEAPIKTMLHYFGFVVPVVRWVAT
jgi:hypothetical protein